MDIHQRGGYFDGSLEVSIIIQLLIFLLGAGVLSFCRESANFTDDST